MVFVDSDRIVPPTPRGIGEPQKNWLAAWLDGKRIARRSRNTLEFDVIRLETPRGTGRRFAPEFYSRQVADKFADAHREAMIEAGYDQEEAMREYVSARFVPPKFMQLPFLWKRYYKSPKK